MTPLEERLAELRLRFVERAGEERAAIAGAMGAALDRDTLRRRAHSIAGTAGLFGFTATGDLARALEEAIDGGADDAEVRRLAGVLDASLAALG